MENQTPFYVNSRRAIVCAKQPVDGGNVSILPKDQSFEARRLNVVSSGYKLSRDVSLVSESFGSHSNGGDTDSRRRLLSNNAAWRDVASRETTDHSSETESPRRKVGDEGRRQAKTVQSSNNGYLGWKGKLFWIVLIAFVPVVYIAFSGRPEKRDSWSLEGLQDGLVSRGRLLLLGVLRGNGKTETETEAETKVEANKLAEVIEESNREIQELSDRMVRLEMDLESDKNRNRREENVVDFEVRAKRDEEFESLRYQMGELSKEILKLTEENKEASAQLKEELDQTKRRIIVERQRSGKHDSDNDNGDGPFNFASSSMGAQIIRSMSSPGFVAGPKVKRWLVNAALSALLPKVADTMQIRQLKDIDIVIDEHPIRGPGDCFYIPGNSGNITIGLPLPISVTSVRVEHILIHLDLSPETAPHSASVFVTPFIPKHQREQGSQVVGGSFVGEYSRSPWFELANIAIDTSAGATSFRRDVISDDDDGQMGVSAQRIRFEFFANEKSPPESPAAGMCIYRIKVFGTPSQRQRQQQSKN